MGIAKAIESGFEPTTDLSRAREVDALIICVPTPLNKYREPDLSFVLNTVEALLPHLRSGQVVSLESTTYPGHDRRGAAAAHREGAASRSARTSSSSSRPSAKTRATRTSRTRTIPEGLRRHHAGLPRGRARALRPGDRQGRAGELDPGRRDDEAAREHPPRGQHRPRQRDEDHRRPDGHRHPRGDPRRGDQAVRLRALLSGPGPRRALHPDRSRSTSPGRRANTACTRASSSSRARSTARCRTGSSTRSPTRSTSAASRSGAAAILVLGIAYKKNVDDMRESPSVELMELLQAKGAQIAYSDPHVPSFPKMRRYALRPRKRRADRRGAGRLRLVLLATDHDRFDYDDHREAREAHRRYARAVSRCAQQCGEGISSADVTAGQGRRQPSLAVDSGLPDSDAGSRVPD